MAHKKGGGSTRNGRDSAGDLVPNGSYIYVIEAKSGSKTERRWQKLAVRKTF